MKRKRPNRRTIVRFPIYQYEVRVIFVRDIVATGRRLGEKDDLTHAGAASITFDSRPGVGWLLFEPRPRPGRVAHEASHAICGLQKAAGTTFDEETFAYHLDHLVERIHIFLGA
jgi:hypothetical protein